MFYEDDSHPKPEEKQANHKIYLGDGVYAAFDGVYIVLTTENGYATTNTSYLDPEIVLLALTDLARSVR